METTPEQEIKNLRTKVREGTRKLTRKIIDKLHPKIPPEDIDEHSIAKVILTQLGNPAQKKLKGGKWVNPFPIVDVLANAGYVGILNNTDYAKKFPEAYQKTRGSLWLLVREGVLETLALEEPDMNGETIYYKVTNEEHLREFAKGKPKIQST